MNTSQDSLTIDPKKSEAVLIEDQEEMKKDEKKQKAPENENK